MRHGSRGCHSPDCGKPREIGGKGERPSEHRDGGPADATQTHERIEWDLFTRRSWDKYSRLHPLRVHGYSAANEANECSRVGWRSSTPGCILPQ